MPTSRTRTTRRAGRRLLGGLVLFAAVSGLLSGCAGMPQGPTYTDAELKAICERRGGWWRGDVVAGYCEFQLASFP